MARVYISLGSNTDREVRIRMVVDELRRGFGRLQLSPVYDSAAVGFDGSDFLNLVAALESPLDAGALYRAFHDIEDRLGRDRSLPKFASRPIDIDILLYDDLIIDMPGLRVPRPEILINAFVLKPLQDIAPDLVHPETGQSFAEHWRAMAAQAPRLDLYPMDLE